MMPTLPTSVSAQSHEDPHMAGDEYIHVTLLAYEGYMR
jgi:hypothetical protein